MTTLAAVLLANADGRAGMMLHALHAARGDTHRVTLAFAAAFLVLAAASAAGALLASNMLGLGVLTLFAATALGSAAAALLWTRRAPVDAAELVPLSAPLLFIRLLLLQLGDRNQFLIFALGALSGSALWGAVGGGLGLALTLLPVLALGPPLLRRPAAPWLRWAAAALLILWALLYLRRAFGV